MTDSDLDELVRQARRDRPVPALLSSVARNLRVLQEPRLVASEEPRHVVTLAERLRRFVQQRRL